MNTSSNFFVLPLIPLIGVPTAPRTFAQISANSSAGLFAFVPPEPSWRAVSSTPAEVPMTLAVTHEF